MIATSQARSAEIQGPVDTELAAVREAAQLIRCEDGEPICATLFAPAEEAADAPLLIVNNAMGNVQSRYAATARDWARRGWRVVTWDYRGIGKSARLQRHINRFHIAQWGEQDLTAILDWANERFGRVPTVVLGHSIGGQIVQFCRRLDRIDAAVFVASQKGYWRYWQGWNRAVLHALWYVMPAVALLCGNFPLMRLAGSESLPGGIARDWARWGRHPGFVGEDGRPLAANGGGLRCPVLSISLADDLLYAPQQAVDALLAFYPNATAERLHLVPQECGLDAIGHAGLFDPANFARFWPVVAGWLARHVARGAPHDDPRIVRFAAPRQTAAPRTPARLRFA